MSGCRSLVSRGPCHYRSLDPETKRNYFHPLIADFRHRHRVLDPTFVLRRNYTRPNKSGRLLHPPVCVRGRHLPRLKRTTAARHLEWKLQTRHCTGPHPYQDSSFVYSLSTTMDWEVVDHRNCGGAFRAEPF